ncbi:MAG: rod shape-determining protein MreD [Endomicrobium sp.]|nr:rod shape-determining protein MreD [Endomicrobium sp.]
MKKLTFYIFLYIVFCLLQFSFGKYLNICGIFPNLILILIVYLGLSKRTINAQILGFLLGLTWDAFSPNIFGVRAIMFASLGYFTGLLSKNFDRDRISTQCVVVLFSNIIYWLGFNFTYYILQNGGSHTSFAFITLQGTMRLVVTVIIAPAVFYILDFLTDYMYRET